MSITNNNLSPPTCGQTEKWYEGFDKAYSNCRTWCQERCSNQATDQSTKASEAFKRCIAECRRFQERSPAGQ